LPGKLIRLSNNASPYGKSGRLCQDISFCRDAEQKVAEQLPTKIIDGGRKFR
jgi:hypothetical protein